MLDEYWEGVVSRISPEAPVPVFKKNNEYFKLGGAANVAANIQSLGSTPCLFGVVGDDNNSIKLEFLLQELDIRPILVKLKHIPTISKLRILSDNQQLLRLDSEPDPKILTQNLGESFLNSIKSDLSLSDCLIISDYAKGTLTDWEISYLINTARKLDIPVVIDPKGTDFNKYRNASIITPNIHEFELIVGPCIDENAISEKALDLLHELDLNAILITRGAQGMILVTKEGEVSNVPSNARAVFDVTGAGDTVVATFACAIASNYDYLEACKLANIAAGVAVSKRGTSTVFLDEIYNEIQRDIRGYSPKIVTQESLKVLINSFRNSGKSIVVTNGCFDIIHSGHVDYLQKSKQLGDVLVVAINSDSSVKALKGPSRPINSLEDRMSVLSALECIDFLVSFNELTPKELFEEIVPDVLVKGGDYSSHEVVGSDLVIRNGGRVEIIDFVDGYSTSNIISKIAHITDV